MYFLSCFPSRFGTWLQTNWHSWTPIKWRCRSSWESSRWFLASFSAFSITCKFHDSLSARGSDHINNGQDSHRFGPVSLCARFPSWGECSPGSCGLSQDKPVCQKWHLYFSWAESLKVSVLFTTEVFEGSEKQGTLCPPKPERPLLVAYPGLAPTSRQMGCKCILAKVPSDSNSIWGTFFPLAAASLSLGPLMLSYLFLSFYQDPSVESSPTYLCWRSNCLRQL